MLTSSFNKPLYKKERRHLDGQNGTKSPKEKISNALDISRRLLEKTAKQIFWHRAG
jgi:biotin operon repressor